MKKDYATSIPNYGDYYHNLPGRQLELFTHTGNRNNPQISSIPGISPKQRDRYRVTLGSQVLGDRLTIDEAIKLANGGES